MYSLWPENECLHRACGDLKNEMQLEEVLPKKGKTLTDERRSRIITYQSPKHMRQQPTIQIANFHVAAIRALA